MIMFLHRIFTLEEVYLHKVKKIIHCIKLGKCK